MSCGYAHDDGAYVLGALSPAERRDYERHLAGCPDCSRAVQELAGLVGLLARVPAGVLDEPAAAGEVPEAMLPRLVARVRRAQRRRTWTAMAAAAVAAVVGTLGTLGLAGLLDRAGELQTADPSGSLNAPAAVAPEASRPMVPVGRAPVTADLALTSVPWGTRLDLECRYSSPPSAPRGYAADSGATYVLFVRRDGGGWEQVASWRALPDRTMRLAAATATSRDEIAAVEVRALDGRPLLTLRG